MSRVLMLVSNPCVVDARVIKTAQAVRKCGHEVHVVATAGSNAPLYEKKDGITYHRIDMRLGAYLSDKLPLRLAGRVSRRLKGYMLKKVAPYLKYSFYVKKMAKYAERLKPDIIHAHDLICLPVGAHVARNCKAKLIYDAHELERYRNPPLSWTQKMLVSHLERKYSREAHAVITVGKMAAKVLGELLSREDVNTIYNSPILNDCPSSIREDLKLSDGEKLLISVGKCAQKRGIEDVLALLAFLPKNIHLAVIGPCAPQMRKYFLREAKRHGVSERFHVLPPVPYDMVVSYIKGADLSIISVVPETLSYLYAMPNKLFESAFAEVPILANDLPEMGEFIKEFGIGEIVDFEEDRGIGAQIMEMLEHPERYRLTNEGRERLYAEYSWEAMERKLQEIYGSISASGGR